jgi:hypothetical protein
MPFVHWLPKRPIRKSAIRGCIACGIEPRWDWLAAATPRTRAQAYYEFCNNETFYRRFREVRSSFNRFGLEVTPVVADHPALRPFRIVPSALRKPLVEIPVMLFQTVEILVRKPRDAHTAIAR